MKWVWAILRVLGLYFYVKENKENVEDEFRKHLAKGAADDIDAAVASQHDRMREKIRSRERGGDGNSP